MKRMLDVPLRRDDEICAPLGASAPSEDELRDATIVFDALSDPVRLRIFTIIAAEGEVCSCHLEAPVGKSQPTISHHTRVLAGAGLISGERRGRWTHWSAVPGRLAQVSASLAG